MQYVDVVSCLWFLFNSKIQLFIYRRRHPSLLKFPNVDNGTQLIPSWMTHFKPYCVLLNRFDGFRKRKTYNQILANSNGGCKLSVSTEDSHIINVLVSRIFTGLGKIGSKHEKQPPVLSPKPFNKIFIISIAWV